LVGSMNILRILWASRSDLIVSLQVSFSCGYVPVLRLEIATI
jgi:hypothetical protein